MLTAQNPENWQTVYTYYPNGKLYTRTISGNITATMTYDALNRQVTKSYSDGTPSVRFCYDGAHYENGNCTGSDANEVGFLTGAGNQASSGRYKHQVLGLMRWSSQTTGGQTYTFGTQSGDGYTYDTSTAPPG